METTDGSLSNLKNKLEEAAKLAGVIGYIRRDAATATVNLKEHDRVQEYALLASETFATLEQLADVFGLGKTLNMVVDCKEFKLLCMQVCGNSVSVFMDKTTDPSNVKRLLGQ